LPSAYVPHPQLHDDELFVQVHAAGVNLLDCKIRDRELKRILPYRLITSTPAIPHFGFDVCTKCAYTEIVGFEWDEEAKAGTNFRKHSVRMPAAIPVFDDPYAITITDDESDPNEQRFLTLGMGAAGRLLVVAYTWRGNNIRIVSARPAEAHECEEYEADR
jgi:uncharacterized DUF497 family protein